MICLPLVLLDKFRRLIKREINFSGDYNDWKGASTMASGYDSNLILDRVKSALLKVKYGDARYERDSVLFDEIQLSFPVLAALLRVAIENNNNLSVLDFGGSLGSSYFQCRCFLSVLSTLQWNIIEQEHFVRCGKDYFETNELKFFYKIEECLAQRIPNIALLSSVLQYVPEPFRVLDNLFNSNIPYIVIDRTSFSDRSEDFITVQHVPPDIYPASYPCWVFARKPFIERVSLNYEVLAEFDSTIDHPVNQADLKFKFGGMILRRK